MPEGPTTESGPGGVSDSEWARAAGSDPRPGDRVGHYLIRERLGEGGFAVVYAAEQTEPMRRRVALKIIKVGMDTRQVIARFEAERQALALMDHPHVARVFDAGATPAGRPYFVMELVPGARITEFCDKHRFDIDRRLELFMQVCEAVQHAHQKGIIHRDIKPSNVMVTAKDGKPSVKVIDFGVAKAIDHRLTEKTIFTGQGLLIGTPEYMSPEQVEMTAENVDTRTDIYSLGALLYELLVGTLPYDPTSLRHAALSEIQRIIREDEPPTPSHRLSGLGEKSTECAEHRHVDIRTLVREVRGDLDWITMKALEKDRTRRYSTASEFGADIRRHLIHEPIEARPPSVAYRARKFVRRHRVGVAASSVIALALIAGIAGTTMGMVRANRAEAKAQREARITEKINEFLQTTLGAASPDEMGRDVKVIDVLAKAAADVGTDFTDEPEIEAAVRNTLGTTFWGLGLLKEAKEQLGTAIELRKVVLGPEHVDTLACQNSLGVVLRYLGEYDTAENLYRQTLAALRRTVGDEHEETMGCMNNNAVLYTWMNRLEDAERLHRETLRLRRHLLGEEHRKTLSSMTNLAIVLQRLGRLDEAEDLASKALEVRQRVLGEEHARTLQSMHVLALVLWQHVDLAPADSLNRETLELAARVFGDDHPHTLSSRSLLARGLLRQERFDEAEVEALEYYHGSMRAHGPEHGETRRAIKILIDLYEAWDKPDKASSWRARLPPDTE
ncbi:MAG: tetratricopeptide repeat protein [Planctomycetota bacterium]|jgi:non-specific serine/threonine protein kinase/serine/threonine-protein kinase